MSQERNSKKKGFIFEQDDYITDPDTGKAHVEPAKGPDSLGRRVARIRLEKKLSVEDLSSRTEIDAELLRKLENNEYTPPLGELIKLGKALEMKMGYFISSADSTKRYAVVRARERRIVARYASGTKGAQGYHFESLAPDMGDRVMEPFIVTMHPNDNPDMSTHDGQEFIFVLEGTMEAHIEDHVELLEPGDSIYYDSTRPHKVKCHGDKVTRIVAVLVAENK